MIQQTEDLPPPTPASSVCYAEELSSPPYIPASPIYSPARCSIPSSSPLWDPERLSVCSAEELQSTSPAPDSNPAEDPEDYVYASSPDRSTCSTPQSQIATWPDRKGLAALVPWYHRDFPEREDHPARTRRQYEREEQDFEFHKMQFWWQYDGKLSATIYVVTQTIPTGVIASAAASDDRKCTTRGLKISTESSHLPPAHS